MLFLTGKPTSDQAPCEANLSFLNFIKCQCLATFTQQIWIIWIICESPWAHLLRFQILVDIAMWLSSFHVASETASCSPPPTVEAPAVQLHLFFIKWNVNSKLSYPEEDMPTASCAKCLMQKNWTIGLKNAHEECPKSECSVLIAAIAWSHAWSPCGAAREQTSMW